MADLEAFHDRMQERCKSLGSDADFFSRRGDTSIFDAYPVVGDQVYRVVVPVDLVGLSADPFTVYRRDTGGARDNDVEIAFDAIPAEVRACCEALVATINEELAPLVDETLSSPPAP